jgi:hypothetical protein
MEMLFESIVVIVAVAVGIAIVKLGRRRNAHRARCAQDEGVLLL